MLSLDAIRQNTVANVYLDEESCSNGIRLACSETPTRAIGDTYALMWSSPFSVLVLTVLLSSRSGHKSAVGAACFVLWAIAPAWVYWLSQPTSLCQDKDLRGPEKLFEGTCPKDVGFLRRSRWRGRQLAAAG